MKRIAVFLLLSLSCSALFAQSFDYRPRESWPYLLESFTRGELRMRNGNLLSDGFYNVSVVDGKLHYVNDGTIMVANMLQVYTAMIGTTLYCNYEG